MRYPKRQSIASAAALFAVATLVGQPRPVAADEAPEGADELPATLDAAGAIIDSVVIVPDSIFDLDNPKENKFLYRLANRLHITTKPGVIAQQMLFNPGDTYSPRLLEETERLLRGNRYIQDATVQPTLNEDGNVDVKVHTSDTWTLSPRISFSRAGGSNNTVFGLKEMNLLGRGVALEGLYSSDIDRDSRILKIVDRNVGDTWYDLHLDIQDNSDGYSHSVRFGKPFYALDTTLSNALSYYDNERIDAYYDLGDITGRYLHDTQSYEASLGWSDGLRNGRVKRYITGVGYDEHRFYAVDGDTYADVVIPGDRKLLYPFFGIEWLQDDFEETHNFNQISRTEDYYLGSRVQARLGYAGEFLGSDRNAWLVDVDAQTRFGDLDTRSLFLTGSVHSRIEGTTLRDFGLDLNARYYDRQSDRRLFFASLGTSIGIHPDADHQLFLGGDNGLRGYPLRYQNGTTSALLTLEQRFFTDWYPLRLVRVGGAVFFDSGRTWGENAAPSTNLGWLRDVGIGLRLGSTRSGLGNMVHIDLAWPLDGDSSIDSVQYLVSTKRSF